MSKHDSTFLDTSSIAPRPSPAIASPTFSVLGHSIINAPASAVRDALLDIPSYGKWNSFIPAASIHKPAVGQTDTSTLQQGSYFEFKVKMSEKQTTSSKELCTLAEPLKAISDDNPTPTTTVRWVMDSSGVPMLASLLKAEHVNEITDLGDGRTEYVHWESFGGVIASVIKWSNGESLRKNFEAWAEELKKYVESTHGAS